MLLPLVCTSLANTLSVIPFRACPPFPLSVKVYALSVILSFICLSPFPHACLHICFLSLLPPLCPRICSSSFPPLYLSVPLYPRLSPYLFYQLSFPLSVCPPLPPSVPVSALSVILPFICLSFFSAQITVSLAVCR
jgi:hypothetical protein